MAQIINGYTITNNNMSRTQRASVTVKNARGQRCARVYSDKGRLLERIRNDLLLPERLELVGLLQRAGVAQADIDALLDKQASSGTM